MDDVLLLANFSVMPDAEPGFNRYFHKYFLPALLNERKEFTLIRRYEETGVGGSLRWYNKQFLTVMHLGSSSALSAQCDEQQYLHCSRLVEFLNWREKSLRNFSCILFRRTWSHARGTSDARLHARPFFLWQLEMRREEEDSFQQWYETQYLPLQIAEIPTWTSVTRFKSIAREVTRYLTVFECLDECNLARSLVDLRAAHRIEENYEWQRRVERGVLWHDATSFRPIFCLPD